MSTRPLLLGEAPSPHGDATQPLGGRIARRLCNSLGWTYKDPFDRLAESFELRNLFARAENAEPWDARVAAEMWQDILRARIHQLRVPFVVVAFGRRVGIALDAGPRGFYEWQDGPLYSSVVLPHPSGLNRLWNDPATSVRVRFALQEALRRADALAPVAEKTA